jgi:hypothetical protein
MAGPASFIAGQRDMPLSRIDAMCWALKLTLPNWRVAMQPLLAEMTEAQERAGGGQKLLLCGDLRAVAVDAGADHQCHRLSEAETAAREARPIWHRAQTPEPYRLKLAKTSLAAPRLRIRHFRDNALKTIFLCGF